jgi:hypothetical protein
MSTIELFSSLSLSEHMSIAIGAGTAICFGINEIQQRISVPLWVQSGFQSLGHPALRLCLRAFLAMVNIAQQRLLLQSSCFLQSFHFKISSADDC